MGAACGCAAATPVLVETGIQSHIGPSGVATKQGSNKKPNQDRYVIAPNVGGYEGAHLFAVFDGHGRNGHDVSNFLRANYPKVLAQNSQFPRNPGKALSNACLSVNQMLRNSTHDSEYSGSTGCIALIYQGQLWTANVGDSRAIAGVGGGRSARPEQLTKDHTVGNPKESKRILAAGGRIKNNRVYCKDRDEPGLIPTRAFGDFSGIQAGVIAAPDVEVRQLDHTYKFLVIMSDGIWENVSASKICQELEGSEGRTSKACSKILDESERTVKSSASRYPDDMTVVGVHLGNYLEHLQTSTKSKSRGGASRKQSSALPDEDLPDFSPEEKVKMTIELCEQMVYQGAHPDDASDAVMGLSDEERLEVTIAMAGIKTMGIAPWKEQYVKTHPNIALNNVRRLSGVFATPDGGLEPSYFDENKPAVRSRSNSQNLGSRMSMRRASSSLVPNMNKRRNSLPPMSGYKATGNVAPNPRGKTPNRRKSDIPAHS